MIGFCTLFLNLYKFHDQMYFVMIRISRSSHQEVFYKKRVLRNFAKFTGKHLCQGLFFHKVADHRPVTLLKRRFRHRCFPVNFAKFLRTFFLTEHLRSLLLNISTWFQWTLLWKISCKELRSSIKQGWQKILN